MKFRMPKSLFTAIVSNFFLAVAAFLLLLNMDACTGSSLRISNSGFCEVYYPLFGSTFLLLMILNLILFPICIAYFFKLKNKTKADKVLLTMSLLAELIIALLIVFMFILIFGMGMG